LFWVLVIKLCVKRYRAKEHKGKFKYYWKRSLITPFTIISQC
jgi:hypothetical protein